MSGDETERALDRGAAASARLFTFIGGASGGWAVISATVVAGEGLPDVERVDILQGSATGPLHGGAWVLRGVTSHERYATRTEHSDLAARQAGLGQPDATCAALIPIRKSARWWALSQDERRAIFEERSRHIHIGSKYLPAVARRLHHCRDLGEDQPFDFLTLFDYRHQDASAFDDLLAELRATEEWKFVEREIDVRLVRADAGVSTASC